MAETRANEAAGGATRVVILGGGFGGVLTARSLAREAKAAGRDIRVTLVDRNNYFLFTPMLPEVGTGILEGHHITQSLREATRGDGVEIHQTTITALDTTARVVTTDEGLLPYDQLVIALGATTNFFGMKDVEEHALTFKDIPDAVGFHARVLGLLDDADHESDATTRREMLSFVIAGGGLTGVELAAELADFLTQTMAKEYPHLRRDEATITLIEAMDTLLPGMKPAVQAKVRERLEAKGVRVLLTQPVSGATADCVKTEGGEIRTRTLVWAAGIAANPLLATFPFERGRGGRILCDDTMQITGWPGHYALGDCAHVTSSLTSKPYAQSAQIAEREAKHLAANIVRAARGRPVVPFIYDPIGVLISLGDNYSIVDTPRLMLTGLPGFLAWKGVYLAKLPGWRNRAEVLSRWLINAAAGRNTVGRAQTDGMAASATAKMPVVAAGK